jgi:hypothetical protein
MEFDRIVERVGPDRAAEALKNLLGRFLTPAFGSLPKLEIEIIVLEALQDIEAISGHPETYELVSKLKVTRSKARALIYTQELRKTSSDALDERVKELLKRPLIQKAGEQFILEVENPLVSDHLRDKVRQLGHVSDGSFSPSVVRLSIGAIVSLIEHYIPEKDREGVRQALVKAGAPNTSLKGVLEAVLRGVARKIASETGEALAKEASECAELVFT